MDYEPRDFFFSSRRRHTRSLCDWSSDVCSSDLRLAGNDERLALGRTLGEFNRGVIEILPPSVAKPDADDRRRSEERRVGKECRSRWVLDHKKKKENSARLIMLAEHRKVSTRTL